MIHTVTLNPSLDRTVEVDAFEPGSVLRARCVARGAAGKGVNLARGLVALGVPCTAAALAGRWEKPFFRSELARLGAEPVLVSGGGATRANETVIERSTGRVTHLRERGAAAGRSHLSRLARALLARVRVGDLAAVCGSAPPGLPEGAFAEFLGKLRAAGATLLVDTSGEALAEAASVRPEVLTPNAGELAELARERPGSPGEAARLARALLDESRDAGASELVVVTLGAEGAVAVTTREAWHARCPVSEIVSPIGAGDALNAGLVAARAAGASLGEALRRAVACGAANCMEASAGTLDPARVEVLAGRAEVRELTL